MNDEYVHQPDLIERLRWSDGWFFENPWDHVTYASDDPFEAADEIERLREALRDALVYAPDFMHGMPKKHYEKIAIGSSDD